MLSPIVLIIGISNCLGSQYYTPAGLRKQSARYIVYGAIENLLLNIILIPYYGAKGAVIGSLAAEFTITVLYLYNCKGYMTLQQIVSCGWRKTIAGFVMFGVVWYICGVVCNATIAILSSIVVGSLVYAIILLLLYDRFSLEMVDMVRTKLLLVGNKDK